MMSLLAEGFSLGLATGLYCLGACGPLLVPYLLAEGEGGLRPNLRMLAEFLAGRLAAYLLFAAAVGFIGARRPGTVPAWVLGAGYLASGLLLCLYSLAKNAPRWNLCASLARSATLRRLPFALGFIVGLNVCPPFAAGLVRLLELADPARGAAYFAAFFAGTTLYVLPLSAAAPLARFERLRAVASLASGLAGLWFMGLGVSRFAFL